MCRDRANNTISDPRPTSHFRSETTISLSETEKSRPRRRRRHGMGLVCQLRSSDSQASAHSHLSSAATLSAPSRAQFPHLHKEGFLQEHQFPCGVGQGHSHRPWLIIRVRAKAGLGSCQSTSPCDPQTSPRPIRPVGEGSLDPVGGWGQGWWAKDLGPLIPRRGEEALHPPPGLMSFPG